MPALSLAAALRERPGPVQRFLRAALDQDTPAVSTLVQVGVPHWDATALVARLADAGEIGPGGWDDAARASYRSALIDAPASASAVSHLPAAERPREKALERGIDALGDAELLALLLRTGTQGEGVLELAQRLLGEHAGLAGLARLPADALAQLDGLGPAKGTELAAAFVLGARASAGSVDRPRLRTPEEVNTFVTDVLTPAVLRLPHEELWCLALDPQLRLIGRPRVVTRGDVDGTDAGPRAFFRIALGAGATQAIAVHNHPSGDPTPSTADRAVTRRLVEAGRVVDLPLRDHLIIGAAGRYTALSVVDPALFR